MNPLYKTPEAEKLVMAIYDEALENWPVPYETLTLPTRHGETFVIASGKKDAPALILLHGAGGNSSMWAGEVADYTSHYRVCAVDLPGEAGKSAANRPAWDSRAFAEWLEDVLGALKIERAALVGLSQGAWTALRFATLMPHRVEKLVLIAPGGIVPDKLFSFMLRAVTLSMLGKWGFRRLVRDLFGDQIVPEGVIERVAEISGGFNPRIGVLPLFSDEELRRLTMPIYLIGGSKDIMRDLTKIEKRMRGLFPTMPVTIIAGGGHALINTSNYVLKFLKT